MVIMQRAAPPFETQHKNTKKAQQKIQALQLELTLIFETASITINELRIASNYSKAFLDKFQAKKIALANNCDRFITVLEAIYMQDALSTKQRPCIKALSSFKRQILNKKMLITMSKEQQYNEDADTYTLLMMLLNKFNALYKTCLEDITLLETEEENDQEAPLCDSSINENNELAESENNLVNHLADEIWLSIIGFLDSKTIMNFEMTNSRFRAIARDKRRYQLFPIATDFTNAYSILNRDFKEITYSALSSNGKWLAVAEKEKIEGKSINSVSIYTLAGHFLYKIPLKRECSYVGFTQNNEKLVICYTPKKESEIIKVFNTQDWKRIKTIFTDKSTLYKSKICINNTHLFMLWRDHQSDTQLISYDLYSGKKKALYNLGKTCLSKLIISTDQTNIVGLAPGANQEAVCIMNIQEHTPPNKPFFASGKWMPNVTHIQLTPDSKKIVFFSFNNQAAVSEYDIETNKHHNLFKLKHSTIHDFKISHDGRYFVAIIQKNNICEINIFHLKKRNHLVSFSCPCNGLIENIYIDNSNTKIIIIQTKGFFIYTFGAIQPDFDKLRKEHEENAPKEQDSNRLIDTQVEESKEFTSTLPYITM